MADAAIMATMPLVELDDGCRIVFEARDPATGAEVAGVLISAASIYGEEVGGGGGLDGDNPSWVPDGDQPVSA